jgi:predicted amidohydrolase
MTTALRVAAIQLKSRIADSASNIAGCRRLAERAVAGGAAWIALPEFFNTGVAWEPKLAAAIEGEEGPATWFLREFSRRHGVMLGGSFLCRLEDGSVRNRYLAFARGVLIGRHDKDLPTMWENAFYEGGSPEDTGVLGPYGGIRAGAAVCWEFMRSMTARRLRGSVDVIVGGSCWWSLPENWPGWIRNRWEARNAENSLACVQDTARLVGAPVIHGAHCGPVDCSMLGLPLRYRGRFEGNAAIIDAKGNVIVRRRAEEGEGVVCAEIVPAAIPVDLEIPDGYWLRAPGPLPWFAWYYQRRMGRSWYRRHVRPGVRDEPAGPL